MVFRGREKGKHVTGREETATVSRGCTNSAVFAAPPYGGFPSVKRSDGYGYAQDLGEMVFLASIIR